MDEIVKVIAGASPVAAVVIILGKQALEVLRDYLRVAEWKQDRIIDRLRLIESKLGIEPPDEEDTQPMPATKQPRPTY
jgi:hypothetical protein